MERALGEKMYNHITGYSVIQQVADLCWVVRVFDLEAPVNLPSCFAHSTRGPSLLITKGNLGRTVELQTLKST